MTCNIYEMIERVRVCVWCRYNGYRERMKWCECDSVDMADKLYIMDIMDMGIGVIKNKKLPKI